MQPCPNCQRPNPAARRACLYCGASLSTGAEEKSAVLARPAAQEVSPVELRERVQARTAARRGECPNCGEKAERLPVTVEFWKFKRYSIWGRRRYFDVLVTSVPGYCQECTNALRWQRIRASLMLSAPIWLMMGIAFTGAIGFSAGLTVFYFGWIIRGSRYSWTDSSVYGDELEQNLKPELAEVEHPPDARIQFPIGLPQSLIRAVAIPAAPILLILLLSAMVGGVHFLAGSRKDEPAQSPTPRLPSAAYHELSDALSKKDESAVARILAMHPEAVRQHNEEGVTPLHLAVKTNDAKIVSLLLDQGAEMEAKENTSNATPLHDAVIGSAFISTRTLLSRGANMNARMKDGSTPLLLASLFPDPALAKLLIEHGADLNALKNDGTSALSFARANHRPELERLLREAGAADPLKKE